MVEVLIVVCDDAIVVVVEVVALILLFHLDSSIQANIETIVGRGVCNEISVAGAVSDMV